jgi:tripartite-type tricarboxylate transporter receptor subunit TctC
MWAQCRAIAVFTLLSIAGHAAAAQDLSPSRPITMIVPFAAGGSTDVIARVVAEAMRGVLEQPVVIDNRGGAGGSIGTAAIAQARPDGYTIGMGTASTLAINPAVYKSLSYDIARDLKPVGLIASVPNVVTVNPSVRAKSVAELVALAKLQPGKMTYGSAGNGSVSHLMGEQFKAATGTDILHVPYRGVGPALNDAVAGQIFILFDNLPTSLPLILDDKLRALAVSSPERLEDLPDVPTFAELKLDGLDWMAFFGLIAPAKTPQPMIDKLNAALAQALASPQVGEILARQHAFPQPGPPSEFAALIDREFTRMKRAVAAAKIEVQ